MADSSDLERELQVLEVELRKLEGEYNNFFGGRLPRPPWETRSRVDQLVKRLDRAYIQNSAHKFRFSTLQGRYAAFIDLWDRALRAREEGRPGPFKHKRSEEPKKAPAPARAEDKTLCVASFTDPMKEMDKLHDLYDTLRDARQELGEESVPFHKFTELVKSQVAKLKNDGAPEVAFRVSVKDGKLNFTAKGLKGSK